MSMRRMKRRWAMMVFSSATSSTRSVATSPRCWPISRVSYISRAGARGSASPCSGRKSIRRIRSAARAAHDEKRRRAIVPLRGTAGTRRADRSALGRHQGARPPYGSGYGGKPIKAFYGAWRVACVAAGCPGRIPHDCRRTAVRALVRAGVSETVAMQLSGHKTRSVFDRYDITRDADKRAAVSQLAARTAKDQPSVPALARDATRDRREKPGFGEKRRKAVND